MTRDGQLTSPEVARRYCVPICGLFTKDVLGEISRLRCAPLEITGQGRAGQGTSLEDTAEVSR